MGCPDRRNDDRTSGDGTGGGRGRRRRVAVATALVCAAGLAVLGAPGVTYAAPGPTPVPTPSASASASSSVSAADDDTRRLEAIHKEVEELYRKAETATDAYNAAGEQLRLQEKSIADLTRRLDAAGKRMETLRAQAGALARAQYRSGGFSHRTQLFLSGSPDSFLGNVSLARKGEQATRRLLTEVTDTKAELERYTQAAGERWKTLDAEKKKREAAKKEIQDRLDAAKQLESRLAAQEKERLRLLEEERARQAQDRWLASDAARQLTGRGSVAATGDVARAIDFATAQIGKDYVWGAEGPDTYDCSGLTLKAWAAAGRAIPRTSQEQWRQLPKVDVKDMRPGDLVIYYTDASHVGMYIGEGRIVHAPRPGRQVTITGAGSMPVLGVVRPG
ncbi:C40 family peptidase [Streptomyces sp. UNOB3_S3]|uniref:C40 family peptidase n=1 Tax=Streptomyces sp. UNOB3_S3 TaxID=2871682 RepID=UPI001E592F56|nr:C40 family peptidase [Streptomyces sp. UNOB3_S3]